MAMTIISSEEPIAQIFFWPFEQQEHIAIGLNRTYRVSGELKIHTVNGNLLAGHKLVIGR
jgi:hypothetical protein